MPQKKAAEKALRQTKKHTLNNNLVRQNIDYLLRQFKKALAANDKAKADDFAKKLIQTFDKATKKHILHRNNAARKKSRVMKKVNAMK